MSSPFAQRRKEIVDVFFFGPEVAEQLSRVRGRNRALRQLQLLCRGMSGRRVLLLDCRHKPSLHPLEFADVRPALRPQRQVQHPGNVRESRGRRNRQHPRPYFVNAILDKTDLRSSGATALFTEWVIGQVAQP